MLSKIIRKGSSAGSSIRSGLRIFLLKLKYPDIKISGSTFIGKNCEIVCVDGGDLRLHNAHINHGTHIHCAKGAIVSIDTSFVGMNSIIVALKNITIKPNCEIAEMVVIRDQDHIHALTDVSIKGQGFHVDAILINENTWIGAKATILKGVEIGKNSVVGAHAVVTKSFPPASILVGVPAKRTNG